LNTIKLALTLALPALASAQLSNTGRLTFENRCGVCHGADANGGELGPAISNRISRFRDPALFALIREGLPARGMPGTQLAATQMTALVRFLRTLKPPAAGVPERASVNLTDGSTLAGLLINRSLEDMQLRSADGRVHLLRKSGDRYREVTSQADWTTYNGQLNGNRYTTLDQINKDTVTRLAPRWTFTLPNTSGLQVTPVVAGGMMYVTSGNQCYALDAGSGRQIWHFQRPRTRNLIGNAAGGVNRGVAVAGDRLFMVTDHAHLLSLNRYTGDVLWDIEMADWKQNYNATSAPLPVGNLIISGTAGGEEGVRGFVAAYDQATGKEVWRFWTVPKAGEPGSETWKGGGIEHGGAATWFTGTYDPELDTVFWPTGNPGADYYGDNRIGDNLYSDSILALNAKTGKLKWYYQFTPHDLWDWDATETPVLVDAKWKGEARKLLLHANRNGFFYVFDRTDGKLLLAQQYVDKVTWAKGIGADGRPIKNPNMEPSAAGTKVCPSQDGASNWFSPSYNPATGLYYVQTLEKCTIYLKRVTTWEAGRPHLGGSARTVLDEKPEKILRALDIQTGKPAWQLSQPGPGVSWGGTLSTSTGLVIFGEESGALAAADAVTGKLLWSFQTSQLWKASPMTYVFDGKQHIGVAAGSTIMSFALVP